MVKKSLFFLCASLLFLNATAQFTKKNYGLKVLDEHEYVASTKHNPANELVEIKKAIPNIVLDIRYATKNNFMKRVMYAQARAFARKPVVENLLKVQQDLNKIGLGLKIYDGYRPYDVTIAFYKHASDKNFVANPTKGSKHNRGCALDLSLVDLKTGKDLPMPTPYDSFSAVAAANYSPLPANLLKNRTLLINSMQKQGFKVLENEWWHFDFIGWQNFDLLNVPFEKL